MPAMAGPITTVAEARRFIIDCYKAVGAPSKHAEIAASNLIEADCRGHYSHGMNRLENYLRDIQLGHTDAKVEPEIIKETAATALVDGKNGLGAVIGDKCMGIAIKKAKDVGTGFVVARGSNHYGIAAVFGKQALNQGLLGLSCSNTSPLMTPTGAKKAALGTNPLAASAPGLQGDSFLLDMATTAVAMGKLELARRKQQPIPKGWALNDQGVPETDAAIAMKAGKLVPLGGLDSGFKGYGLALLVEVLSGILSGSAYGPNIRLWGAKKHKNANLGQCFMAIDPNAFEPGFSERLSDLLDYLRKMEPVDPKQPVIVPGDIERRHMDQVDKDGGLKYVDNQHKTNNKLAEELKVKPMVSKKAELC